MDNECDPGDEDYGVERDWLGFYWHLYTEDTVSNNANRFTVKEIYEVHDEAEKNTWQSVYDSAKAMYKTTDPKKFANFREHATTRGIMHCSDGCNL
jgi:hypothetical protein